MLRARSGNGASNSARVWRYAPSGSIGTAIEFVAKPAAVHAGHRYTPELNAPVDQLVALVEGDFAPEGCNPGVLSAWFAFWGELKFAPHYAEIATSFDGKRRSLILDTFRRLIGSEVIERAEECAEWIDTLTDGYWQELHLFSESFDSAAAVASSTAFLVELLPERRSELSKRSNASETFESERTNTVHTRSSKQADRRSRIE